MECDAYDAIGLQYFNLGQIEKSQKFHQRMIIGMLEPASSEIINNADFTLKKMERQILGSLKSEKQSELHKIVVQNSIQNEEFRLVLFSNNSATTNVFDNKNDL